MSVPQDVEGTTVYGPIDTREWNSGKGAGTLTPFSMRLRITENRVTGSFNGEARHGSGNDSAVTSAGTTTETREIPDRVGGGRRERIRGVERSDEPERRGEG
jgi:hypothetical protein